MAGPVVCSHPSFTPETIQLVDRALHPLGKLSLIDHLTPNLRSKIYCTACTICSAAARHHRVCGSIAPSASTVDASQW
jgi:hypothetical protein